MAAEESPEEMEAVEAPVADAEPVELVEELPGLVASAAEGDEKE